MDSCQDDVTDYHSSSYWSLFSDVASISFLRARQSSLPFRPVYRVRFVASLKEYIERTSPVSPRHFEGLQVERPSRNARLTLRLETDEL